MLRAAAETTRTVRFVLTSKKWRVVAGIGVAALALILILVSSFNGLVNKEARVDQASADLEVQLQRRFDLIPNLVAAVEGALTQERTIFKDIADARTRYAGAASGPDRLAAAGEVEGALSRLLVVVENYPQLKSLENVRDFQVQLEGTENRVAQSRREYNEAATAYNLAVRRFPRSVIAGMFGFDKAPLFESQPGAEKAPVVDLTPGE